MLNQSLPHGLRNVLVYVAFGSAFPPPENSPNDIALLRAANRAMQRKAMWSEDAFLFVLAGKQDLEEAKEAIKAYGFPNAAVVCIGSAEDENSLYFEEEDINAAVAREIERWLDNEHPGAVAVIANEYATTEFWWSGVEHDDNVFDWPFDDVDFAKSLPNTHTSKAETWLTILGHAVDLHAEQAPIPDGLGSDRAAAWAATLCEWLHGFEAASENGYNHFEDYSPALMPSEFYLGFELARLSRNDLETLCEEHGCDIEDMKIAALKAVTADKRAELRSALSYFFGGDAGLYWALYSSIWPDFSKANCAVLEAELGCDDYEHFARLDAPWRYVSEGWSEAAFD